MSVPSPRTKALLALEAQDYEAAVRFCLQRLYRAPDSPGLNLIIAHAYWRLGKLDDAMRSVEIATKYDKSARVLMLLAALRCSQGDLSGAIQATREALEHEPLHSALRFNLATYLAMQGEVAAAIQAYQELIRREPDCVPAHNNLGALLSALGDPDGAIVCLERAQKACPTDPVLGLNLAREWACKGELDRAKAAVMGALHLADEVAEAHALLGWIQERQGLFSEAECAYRRALILGMDSPAIREGQLRNAARGNQKG